MEMTKPVCVCVSSFHCECVYYAPGTEWLNSFSSSINTFSHGMRLLLFRLCGKWTINKDILEMSSSIPQKPSLKCTHIAYLQHLNIPYFIIDCDPLSICVALCITVEWICRPVSLDLLLLLLLLCLCKCSTFSTFYSRFSYLLFMECAYTGSCDISGVINMANVQFMSVPHRNLCHDASWYWLQEKIIDCFPCVRKQFLILWTICQS